ncbi:MAG TPA: ATP-binding protein [Steroidobacteraceae bacterium]|nr:ATP-binding protein [Steroidobacteraceae bacterium]
MQPRRVEIRFPGTHEGFAQAFDELRQALDREALDAAARYDCELIFEEIVDNIVSHGAVGDRAPDVHVTLEHGGDSIVLTFDDDGVLFDPRGLPDPVPAKSLQEAKIGGFGLMLVRHAASSLDYVRTSEGRNRLTVKVRRRPGPGGTSVSPQPP